MNSLKEGAMWCIDLLLGSILCATMEELVNELFRELEFSHCELLLLEADS
jgi:hypothetical protein